MHKHVYLAEAAESLDLKDSGKENISEVFSLLAFSGDGWL